MLHRMSPPQHPLIRPSGHPPRPFSGPSRGAGAASGGAGGGEGGMGALLGVASQLRPPRVRSRGRCFASLGCDSCVDPPVTVVSPSARDSGTTLPPCFVAWRRPPSDRHELRCEAREQRWKREPLTIAAHQPVRLERRGAFHRERCLGPAKLSRRRCCGLIGSAGRRGTCGVDVVLASHKTVLFSFCSAASMLKTPRMTHEFFSILVTFMDA